MRHEEKYVIGPHIEAVLRTRLKRLLRPDPNAGPSGDYLIRSLYFDDVEDSALYDKISGVGRRQKIRLRTYGVSDRIASDRSLADRSLADRSLADRSLADRSLADRTAPDPVIMLEKKIKSGSGVEKERLRVSRAIYEAMRTGNAKALREVKDPLLDETAWLLHNRLLRPKVVVIYVREAYVFPAGNVRITLDKGLRSGLSNLDLFRSAPSAPAPVDGMTILEVKYDEFLPRPVQDILQTGSLTRQAVSKYALCRSMCKTHFWEDE